MFLLLACVSPTLPAEPAPSLPDGPEVLDDAPGGDTAEDDELPDIDGCPAIYDPSVVQAFNIEITEEEWGELQDDYARGEKDYHPVVFRWGDEVVPDAMIRLKGNPNFSWFTEKMQFVVAFNEVNPDGRFQGLRKISLDASWYEPTLLRDRVAWQVIRRQGALGHACANTATLSVNGAFYGVYTNIEFFDHEWLERTYGDANATGTLWKYGYDPVSNEEASTGAAIARMNDTTDPEALAALGDLDNWVLEWAAEMVLGNDDGYVCCNHNYYLYEHPTRGILFVPWDLDDAFDVQDYDVDPLTGYYSGLYQQPHFLALTRDAVWGPRYLDALAEMNAAMDPDTTLADLDAWRASIAEALEADPNRSFSLEAHTVGVERMRAWVRARHAYLDSYIACARGETTDADGDGVPVCSDPHDADATVFPGAVETCTGVYDAADGWVDDAAACDDCVRRDVDDEAWLFCRWPRTNDEAAANCAARGGALAGPPRTEAATYVYFFYSWPVRELWWTDEGNGSARCTGWDEATFSTGTAACPDPHPSICAL